MTNRSTAVPRLSWAEVCARRLDRHKLSTPVHDGGPADIVAAMCGAHAQVMSAAELSIGLRLAGAHARRRAGRPVDRAQPGQDVRAARHRPPAAHAGPATVDRRALRAPAVARTDSRRRATDARSRPTRSSRRSRTRWTDAELTIDEFSEAVVAALGPWAGDLVMPAFQGMWPRWRQAMHTAANPGRAVLRPEPGAQGHLHQPAPLAARIPTGRRRPTALAELVRRYLHAYGPATPQHFAQWLTAPRRWATDLFDSLADELQRGRGGGHRAWVPAGDTAIATRTPRRAAAALLRRLHGRLPSARAALPRSGRRTRAGRRPGRQLPGAARSTERSPGSGTSAAPARSSTSPSNR